MKKIQNQINKLFTHKKEDILSIYFTAGFPKLNDTAKIIKSLSDAGADLIEIGIPFSDSVVDGPTIQHSNQVALKNGMTLDLLLNQLEGIRETTDIPLIMMGYLNPIYQYGVERFCKRCKSIGIDGLIIPDLPIQEYERSYRAIFEENNLHMVFLISPQTSSDRMEMIDRLSDSFIYVVSSAATTGAKSKVSEEQVKYFGRINTLKLKNPRLIGFGISNYETFSTACKSANGAIIGSAFVSALKGASDIESVIKSFVNKIRNK